MPVVKRMRPVSITNSEFVRAVFKDIQPDEGVWLTSFAGKPKGDESDWGGRWYSIDRVPQFPADHNCYFSIAAYPSAAKHRTKRSASAVHCLVLDDIGTKVIKDPADVLAPTWRLETSPGNFQVGYVLREPYTDKGRFNRLINALDAGQWTDPGMKTEIRYARLPVGVHGAHGDRPTRLLDWRPERRYTFEEVCAAFSVDLDAERGRPARGGIAAAADPYLLELKRRAMLKQRVSEDGWHDMTCPWIDDHTDGDDSGTAYKPGGSFKCHHGHCEERRFRDLRAWLQREGADVAALDAAMPGEMGALLRGVDTLIYVGKLEAFVRRDSAEVISKEALNDLHRHESSGPFSIALTSRDDLIKVFHPTYRPGQELLIDERGERAVNLWRQGRIFRASSVRKAWVKIWVDHLAWLYPSPRDRRIVLDILVHLVQHRGMKLNFYLVLVSKNQGAGRDTLLKPVFDILGNEPNVRQVSGDDLVGAFNPFVRAEVVYVTELDTSDTSRKVIYNKLKSLAVTPPDYVTVNEKFIPQYELPKVANIVICTNSPRALMIPQGDRRVVVIETVRTEAEIKAYAARGTFDRLHRAYRTPGWIENFYAYLASLKPSEDFNPKGMAPDTEAKERMRVAAESEIHRVLREAIEDHAGPFAHDLVTIQRVSDFLMSKSIKAAQNTISAELDALGAVYLGKNMRISRAGRVIRLWAVREVDRYRAMSRPGLDAVYPRAKKMSARD